MFTSDGIPVTNQRYVHTTQQTEPEGSEIEPVQDESDGQS